MGTSEVNLALQAQMTKCGNQSNFVDGGTGQAESKGGMTVNISYCSNIIQDYRSLEYDRIKILYKEEVFDKWEKNAGRDGSILSFHDRLLWCGQIY